jgi:glutathione S-transferase
MAELCRDGASQGLRAALEPKLYAEAKESTRELLGKKFDYVQKQLGSGPYLVGDTFTLPDAYLFVMLTWTKLHEIDLSRWPGLTAFLERVRARPAVQEAMRTEGLVK